MHSPELHEIAAAIVAPGKVIVALDESPATMGKRFEAYGIENTFENRAAYRGSSVEIENIEEYGGGVILHPEMLDARASDGSTLAEVIASKGMHVIAKVDLGLTAQPLSPDEKTTKGRDDLEMLMLDCISKGATATKWRSVIRIDRSKALPTWANVNTVVNDMAIYAETAQSLGLVPILEPEVLIDGRHDAREAFRVSSDVLQAVSYRIDEHSLDPSGLLLKISMVTPGNESLESTMDVSMAKEIGAFTIKCIKDSPVSSELPGILFLSGGQNDYEATENLNYINLAKDADDKRAYTASFGRVFQRQALKFWAVGNEELAQAHLLHRLRMASLASRGLWTPIIEFDNMPSTDD